MTTRYGEVPESLHASCFDFLPVLDALKSGNIKKANKLFAKFVIERGGWVGACLRTLQILAIQEYREEVPRRHWAEFFRQQQQVVMKKYGSQHQFVLGVESRPVSEVFYDE